MLRGRASERAELGVLLDAVRDGESRVMVVRGDPGIGKSALLNYAISSASGFKVLKAAGFRRLSWTPKG
jgi:predicted ATP-dependent serine protease